MVKSMTGYGLGKNKSAIGMLTAEIKSLNCRYLEINMRSPERIQVFDKKIKDILQSKIKRGRVSLFFNFESDKKNNFEIKINKNAAQKYYLALKKLKAEFNLKNDITLSQILSFSDVLEYKQKKQDLIKEWPKVKAALEAALSKFIKSRSLEGKFIYNDLLKRAYIIEKLLSEITKRIPHVLNSYKKRFLKRIRRSQLRTMNNEKIELEFASFAQSCDVSEEITRIGAHVKNFKGTLKSNNEIGKKLDFIAQELSREANTIAAKSQDFKISNKVIEIKAEIEKIREQVQNVE